VGYARAQASWLEDGKFVLTEGAGEYFEGSVEDPLHLTPYNFTRTRKADAYDRGAAGYGVRLDGDSLMGEKDGKEFAIGLSKDRNIVFGGSMMRNEFGFSQGYEWAPDGHKIAFYRKDQSRVSDFPLLNIKTRTGELELIKYPMNGMESELLKVGIYDFDKETTVWLDVTDFTEERYITNLSWSPDAKSIYAQVLDRSQHHMKLNQYDARDGHFVRTVLTEDNEAWVEPQDPIWFLEGRGDRFIYRTDNRDGYKNLYLVDTLGKIQRFTAVDADVEYVTNDGQYVYYTSAQISPVENHLFRQPVKKGKAQQLTRGRGWHTIQLSKDRKWFLDRQSNLNNPVQLYLGSADGKRYVGIGSQRDPLEGYASCRVELGTVPSADGLYENYYRLIYPKDFDPSKKYPVVLYVYGGPHSQLVQDSWLGSIRMWEMLMAQKGYMVYVQDNRGTSNRGAAFEKAINRQCGKAEMEDQMVGIKRLMALPYVDASRIGVHGWSYGGFMTISLMTTYPDVFKVGVAGGPVIDWKWYEVMYGERYMDNPETNPEGFAATSLIGKAPQLRGKLLICQGAIDDTVVWEHSLSFIQECIDRLIPVDYFPYPVAKHNVGGRNRIHLMDKVTQYFEDYL
jgi:dipeptidyl-peptidase-4